MKETLFKKAMEMELNSELYYEALYNPTQELKAMDFIRFTFKEYDTKAQLLNDLLTEMGLLEEFKAYYKENSGKAREGLSLPSYCIAKE